MIIDYIDYCRMWKTAAVKKKHLPETLRQMRGSSFMLARNKVVLQDWGETVLRSVITVIRSLQFHHRQTHTHNDRMWCHCTEGLNKMFFIHHKAGKSHRSVAQTQPVKEHNNIINQDGNDTKEFTKELNIKHN